MKAFHVHTHRYFFYTCKVLVLANLTVLQGPGRQQAPRLHPFEGTGASKLVSTPANSLHLYTVHCFTVYIRCTYGIFGREITKYMVTYGVCMYGSGQFYKRAAFAFKCKRVKNITLRLLHPLKCSMELSDQITVTAKYKTQHIY